MHSRQGREAGFTIIEALVALAVVTAVLAGIGALIATSARGTRVLERHDYGSRVGIRGAGVISFRPLEPQISVD